ncbi:hypothetical protein [Paracoccus sp. SM22M-07]|uniref:hypothetical protein n=1 Tax=Paracoccus sp. SM22M-07 TaxID=1520813 RepID=UPI0009233E3E|nr:hypothetical protein [Paracoccus sp. SM22M-07]OJH45380.1 hypothetical protein IE00_06995 [Paracoccus sp. SM22M-07]
MTNEEHVQEISRLRRQATLSVARNLGLILLGAAIYRIYDAGLEDIWPVIAGVGAGSALLAGSLALTLFGRFIR